MDTHTELIISDVPRWWWRKRESVISGRRCKEYF